FPGQHFQWKQLAARRDTANADGIVSDGCDDPCQRGAVVVQFCSGIGVVVVGKKIPSMHVVDKTVVVVVDAISGYFAGIGVNIGDQVGMIELDAVIHDGDEDVGISERDIPGA